MGVSLGDYVRALRADDWLTPLLHETAVTEASGWGHARTYVSPSTGAGECAREVQLAHLGYRTAFTEKQRDRMDNGIDTEARHLEKLRRAGVLVAGKLRIVQFVDGHTSFDPEMRGEVLEAEVAARGKVTWSGEIDAVVGRTASATTVHVGDVKTANTHRYTSLPKQDTDHVRMGRVLLRTEGRYVRQLARYVTKLREVVHLWRPGTIVADDAFLLWENTDTQDYRVQWFTVDDWLRNEAERRPAEALAASLRGELLPRPFEYGSRQCRSCYRRIPCEALDGEDEGTWKNLREALTAVASAT